MIGEVKKIIGPIVDKFPSLCSDASVLRYLKAGKYNTKKAAKMLKRTIKWRFEFKPENIRWDDIAQEAATGTLYRADYLDKQGRIVLVMRPGVIKGTNSATMQIKYLVYCLENAILNLSSNQEQMVWLIDFQGWSTSSISLKFTKQIAQVLQGHYPERLSLAIFYDPPKIFESFLTVCYYNITYFTPFYRFYEMRLKSSFLYVSYLENLWNFKLRPIDKVLFFL
ncbi:putative CRAL-TRIO lipid binding domain, CRAL/TRIO domain-containing protein [Lupinus albus]|uniref:Putative CRAL-TRIO lipid binding domain, CRAL/TRIO domain-containing protein n=1 Tax=Lupinus albus TaxID=3870 RepID=A0A6A4NQ59_LUPAL|nr:putative CRAL-TRIO lipid binding domain, CRAL/TRIO domain-containing protein [Lupinus albus]